ncbi:MAG TPA: undecaprenyl-diphosphate phosphatase [bacterium]|nr:undecaprenyl-diphosphate phosphatase [bacterium]
MTVFEALLLGILQGFTEFLPISSSGHLVLAETYLNFQPSRFLFFDVLLHAASLTAVCVFYRKRLVELVQVFFTWFSSGPASPERDYDKQLIIAQAISTVITGLIGIFFKDALESVRDHIRGVALSFLLTGALLTATRWAPSVPLNGVPRFPIPAWLFAVILGVAQGIAILPGVSRSGSTISIALLLGMGRVAAVEYSFLMSIPAILGACLLEFREAEFNVPWESALTGFAGSLAASVIFLWVLVWIVRKGHFHEFAYYVIPLGLFLLFYT